MAYGTEGGFYKGVNREGMELFGFLVHTNDWDCRIRLLGVQTC